jgi:hypothetical protein
MTQPKLFVNPRSVGAARRSMPGVMLTVCLLLLASLGIWQTGAQEATPEPSPEVTAQQIPTATNTPPPLIEVTTVEPNQITAGQDIQLSIFGLNFTPATRVRLRGYGLLLTNYISSTVLTAIAPSNLPPKINPGYVVEVIDPVNQAPVNPSTPVLRVVPLPTPTNPPPTPAPPPTSTIPPTDVPGAPTLIVRSFNASPNTIAPGGTVTFVFDVVNQGSRNAQGVSVSVDPGGKFIPANGQATVLLPDLAVGGVVTVNLTVVTARDIAGGPQTVPITMSFRDFTGTPYTSKGILSVNVRDVPQSSQITLARYLVDPNPVKPGKPAKVTVLLTNSGNETASQVLVRVTSEGGLLLAGPRGDSFPVGDLRPGASASVEMPLVVSVSAKAGPQPQGLAITYLQKGEAKTTSSSMTIEVGKVVATAPLLLLREFSTGKDVLKPGDQFTLDMQIENVGDEDAANMLVTFGTVPASSDATPGGGSSSSTTSSTTFAPVGFGGSVFVGTVKAKGGKLQMTQTFIVNGSVDSGIYGLPITLRYQKADGANGQDSLSAPLVVVMPPQLQLSLQNPVPPLVNVGEPVSLALRVGNKGKKQVNFVKALVEAENGEVVSGQETPLNPMQVNDDVTINASVNPTGAGPVKITLMLVYLNDLNRQQSITEVYESEAVIPPTQVPITPVSPIETPPPTEQPVNQRDLLGRILLALLGLGS